MAYTDKQKTNIINNICQSIGQGSALRTAIKGEGISTQTFYIWIKEDAEKSKQYAIACEERALSIFEDILTIADDQEGDVIKDADGNEVTNHNVIQRARLRVDSRKWMLSKLMPKKYGEKLQTENEHKGEITIVRHVKT